MLSSPLGSTHRWIKLGVACLHGPWEAQIVGRSQALHDIIAF
ncbi:hypothetical protein [Acinetobacter baumannii]